jgi:hypothetical protein
MSRRGSDQEIYVVEDQEKNLGLSAWLAAETAEEECSRRNRMCREVTRFKVAVYVFKEWL